jgi:hypothetical protein
VSGLGQLFPGVKNFRGSLEVLSDTPIPAVALRCSSGTMTTFPTVSMNQSFESVTLHFPQVVVGPAGTYRTTIVLTNPGYFPVSGTLSLSGKIQFRNSSGTILVPKPDSPPEGTAYDITVPAKGALFLESTWTDTLLAGYAILNANHGLGGVVIFSQFDATGRLLTEAAVPPAPISDEFLIFAQTDGGYNTGVALANINPMDVQIGFQLHAECLPDGNMEGEPIGLEGGRHKAELISGQDQLFPDFLGTGTLDVHCTTSIPAVALRLTATTMTAVPVIPIAK